MLSMTGYGSAAAELGRFSLAVEVRSVNGKGLRLSLRLDDALRSAENEAALRRLVSESVSRGRVTLTAALEPAGDAGAAAEVDEALAERYLEAAAKLAGKHGLETGITAGDLLALPGVVGRPDPSREDPEELSGKLLAAARRALEEMDRARAREGGNLAEAMAERVERISAGAEAVMRDQEERVSRRFEALRRRVDRLLESPPAEESRLLQELALIADRVDVSEEYERLRSHVSAALRMLRGEGEGGGRKLGFVLQEMHRELNTMGSKVDESGAQMQVVDMKNDLAALREQVANLE
jgi:uncharacterized protein (TIGR00255 family)